jgi:uncharacterized RmlC-like cupin family protein
MAAQTEAPCRVIRSAQIYEGKQRTTFFAGIASGTAGSQGICMHRVTIPPGARGEVHKHEHHESALYVLRGAAETWFGDRLQHRVTSIAGDFLYIPAGVVHVSVNLSDTDEVEGVLARTDPNEQESVVLLPELEQYLGDRK